MAKFADTFLNWEVMAQYAPKIVEGFFVTIQLAAAVVATGIAVGLALAVVRTFRVRAANFLIVVIVDVLRALPPLVLIMILYFALPTVGIKFSGFVATWIALSAILAAFSEEIFWAGILAVPRGQWEAAMTVGMGPTTTLRRVVLPQAARIAVPPLSNTLISLVKDTSLVSVVLVTELLRKAQEIAGQTFEFFTLYSVAAVYYWVVCFLLSIGQARLETRLSRHVAV